jgi:hypothetical protein
MRSGGRLRARGFGVQRQQLDADVQRRHGGQQGALELAAQAGGAAQAPVGRQVQVHAQEQALAGAPAHRMVHAQAGRAGLRLHEAVHHGVDLGLHLGLDRCIHQALGRAPDQLPALAQDVQRHHDRHRRVHPVPAREHDQGQAQDHAGRGPHVGDQVARVALQRHRAAGARRAA